MLCIRLICLIINLTDDLFICQLSLNENRIVISKDSDFYDRYFQKLEPHKLIFVTVGNASTDRILQIFSQNWQVISEQIEYNNIVEITQHAVITID
jgi:predicted nuclease of predicted toxin-antitoxin system